MWQLFCCFLKNTLNNKAEWFLISIDSIIQGQQIKSLTSINFLTKVNLNIFDSLFCQSFKCVNIAMTHQMTLKNMISVGYTIGIEIAIEFIKTKKNLCYVLEANWCSKMSTLTNNVGLLNPHKSIKRPCPVGLMGCGQINISPKNDGPLCIAIKILIICVLFIFIYYDFLYLENNFTIVLTHECDCVHGNW